MQGLLSFGLGLLLAGFGVYQVKETLRFQRDGVQVQGTVVEVRTRLEWDEDGVSLMQRPIIEFVPLEPPRAPQRFESEVSTSWPWSHAKGERVAVAYLRGDPAHARLDGVVGNWIIPVVLLMLGAWSMIARPEWRTTRSGSIELD